MTRFFISQSQIPSLGEFCLDGENGRHGAKVLRLRPGEEVVLCDGECGEWLCTVKENQGERLLLLITGSAKSKAEPDMHITLCQCLPKGDKLETVTQKAVELGAYEIWPVASRYCVTKWDAKTEARKLARLQKISLEAAMQSGRGIVPKVLAPAALEDALRSASARGDLAFLYEKATRPFYEGIRGLSSRVFVFVGPEGGFAPEEAALAQELGARMLSLGPRILRTETAAIAALSGIALDPMFVPEGYCAD